MITSLIFWRKKRRAVSTMQTSNGLSTMNSAWNEKTILERDTRYANIEV
jgi:hypothetical protein